MIRAATLDDAPSLARLNREVQIFHARSEPDVYRVTPLDELERWLRELLSQQGSAAIVYERGGEAIGYAVMRYGSHEATAFLHARSYLYVDQLGVAPEARRTGVGRALMAAVHRRAAELGVHAVELDVRAVNAAARAFYAELGYSPTRLSLRRPAAR